jgi:hypothetical protein
MRRAAWLDHLGALRYSVGWRRTGAPQMACVFREKPN